MTNVTPAGAPPHLLAFGDSLTAGYGLARDEAFPARLEALLQPRWPGARVVNAGVSGDTTADGLRRLPATLSRLTSAVDLAIVEFGANDLLRGIPPARTRANLAMIVEELGRCAIPVLLATFRPPPALEAIARGHAAIHADVASAYGVPTAPFFPTGVLGHPELVLFDRIHPNARAIGLVAEAMAPVVSALLARTATGA